MSKRNKIIISVFIVFILGAVGILIFSFNTGYKITISNHTDSAIVKLELGYKYDAPIYTIPLIEAKKSWKGKIATNNILGENAIILTYKDNKGNSYEEYVVGYIEKGYRGKADVLINKIDENGKLEIEVK